MRRSACQPVLSLGSQRIAKGEGSFLGDKAYIVEMIVNIKLEAGSGCTFGRPLKQRRFRNSNNPGCGSEVIVPLALEDVGLPLVPTSYSRRVFKPFCHGAQNGEVFTEVKLPKISNRRRCP